MLPAKYQPKKRFAYALVSAGYLFIGLASVSAQTTASWVNPVSGTWTDASKWSIAPQYPNNGFPGVSDQYDVFLGATGSPHTVTLNSSVAVNSLSISSPDTTFRLNGTLTAGSIQLSAGILAIDGGTISGNIASVGNASLTVTSAGGWLVSATLKGQTAINLSQSPLFVENGLTFDSGSISIAVTGFQASRIVAQGSQTLAGTGSIFLRGTSVQPAALNTYGSSSDVFTIGSGINVVGASYVASLGGDSLNYPAVLNYGTVSSTGTNTRMYLVGHATNLGTVEAKDGGNFLLDSQFLSLSNRANGVLTGGRWAVYGNSTITYGSSTITTNNATITLSGLNSSFVGVNSLRNNMGRFIVTNDRDFTSVGSLTNSGTLTVGPQSVLRTSGDLFNTGTVDLAGGVVLVDYPPGAPANGNALLTQLGTSIVTSSALANPALRVGYADNTELNAGTFAAQAIDASTMIFTMALAGDSNLDGSVNTIDFNRLAGNFGVSGASWLGSDFDYNHVVDSIDFSLLVSGYGQKLPSAASPQLGALVPEPSFLCVVPAAVALQMRRRRNEE